MMTGEKRRCLTVLCMQKMLLHYSDPLKGEADSGSGPSHQRQCATETDAALC